MSEKSPTTAAASDVPGEPLLPLGRKAWAIQDGVLPDLLKTARAAALDMAGTRAHAASIPQATSRRIATSTKQAAGAVAVVPLCGVITPQGSWLSMLFGGGRGGLAQFRSDFTDAITSPEVGAVVIDVNSPGGLVGLVPETAAMIRAARGNGKHIVAVANTLAASAAYWIASQADELIVTPSGELGSVGVYMLHEDWSGWNEKNGIDPTYIKVPKYKAEGNIDEPLSDDTKAAWQTEIEDIYGMFVDDIAAGRGVSAATVRSDYGEGRCLLAARALEAGMCDRIATLQEVVGGLLGAPSDAEDTNVITPSGRAQAGLPAGAEDAEAEDAEAEDQPRCACGKWIEAGETECDDCKANADEDDEDDDEDDEESPEDDPVAADDEDEPDAEAQDEQRAALLFD